MAIALTNALLMDIDPPNARHGAIRLDGHAIADVGPDVKPETGDERVDCRGAVVMPGLVNGHTHLYSALAAGMPPPPTAPGSFHDILRSIWWRLDRALDEQSIEMSATVGALDALRCGTTTLVDHHASPNCIEKSLDILERGIDAVGLRAVLCYETTDRNGPQGAASGLAENRRYLERCAGRGDHRFAGLVGAHAAFTLTDESLQACADLAGEFQAGVHVHVAEDPCDDEICRGQYGAGLIQRLEKCGILGRAAADSPAAPILGHCTHLSSTDAERVSARAAAIAHNPRSNMNNRVGYAPIRRLKHVQLGTDGIGNDMWTEAKHAWFKACDAQASLAPNDVLAMLAQAARVAGRLLGCTLGRLVPAAAADIIVTDYVPATPLDPTNAAAHLIFAMGPQHVRDVLIDGAWALRDRQPVHIHAGDVYRRSVLSARRLWQRMQSL